MSVSHKIANKLVYILCSLNIFIGMEAHSVILKWDKYKQKNFVEKVETELKTRSKSKKRNKTLAKSK